MGDGDDEPHQAAPGGRTPLSPPGSFLERLGHGVGALLGFGQRQAGAEGRADPSAVRAVPATSLEVEALHAATAALAGGSDQGANAERVLDVLCRVTRMRLGGLYRLDSARQQLVLQAHRGLTPAEAELLHARAVESTHLGDAFRSGRSDVLDMARVDLGEGPVADFIRRAGWRTQVTLPIRVDGEPWGVIVLVAFVPRALDAAELRLLQAVAQQVGLALSRAVLFAETREESRRLEALTRLAQTLTATLSRDEVLQRVVNAAVELFGSSVARLWLVDDDETMLRLGAEAGAGTGAAEPPPVHVGDGLVGRVAAGRAPLARADVQAEAPGSDAGGPEVTSAAGVPLTVADRLLGVLWIGAREPHEYTIGELALLESLANHAAIAIENARLFSEERDRRTQLAALLDLNTKIAAVGSTEPLLRAIAEESARLIGVDNAGFRLLDGEELVLAGLAGTAAETMILPRIKIGESLSGRVVAEERSVIVDIDPAAGLIPAHFEAARRLGYTAFLGVPIRLGDRTIGVMSFRARRRFTARDQALAEAFGAQAAIAIEHSRLYAESKRRAERMEALADVGRLLSETLDPDEVAQRVAESLLRLFDARVASVHSLDRRTGDLTRVATEGDPRRAFERHAVFPRGTGIIGFAVRMRRPVTSLDVTSDSRLLFTDAQRERLQQAPYRSLLAVPLIVKDAVVGVLAVGDRQGRVFDGEEVRLAEAFADQAALALHNAALHRETEQRRQEAEELAQVARALTALDVAALNERIAQALLTLFRAQATVIRLRERDGSWVTVAWAGTTGQFSEGERFPAGVGLVARAVTEGRAVACADVLAEPGLVYPDETRARIARGGNRAVLAVPLRLKDAVPGVLSVTDAPGRRFTEAEMRLAQAFADQAAVALESAQLHEETARRRREAEILAELARTINASLDLDTVLRRVAEGAKDLCGSDIACIVLREPDSDVMGHRYWVGARSKAWIESRIEPGKGAGGHVLVTGQPLRTDNYAEDPRFGKEYLPISREEGVVAELVVPVRIGDRIEGLLYVDNRSARPFTERDEDVLVRLAEHTAIAIANARLYKAVALRAARLRGLARLNQVVSSSLDVDEVLRAIAQAAADMELLEGAVVSFWVADEASRTLEVRAFSAGECGEDFPLRSVPFGHGPIGWVATHREPLNVPDVFAGGGSVEQTEWWWKRHGLRSFLGLPVVFQGQLLAVVAIARHAPFHLDADAGDVVESFVAQAAVAIRNARIYADTRRRLQETGALLAVTGLLNSTLDARRLLKAVAMKTAEVCHVDRCTIELWDGARTTPLMSQFGDGRRVPRLWQAFRARRPDVREVPAQLEAIETRQPVVVDDARAAAGIPREWVEAFGVRSYMILPLIRQDKVIGIMSLDCCERVAPFQRWQMDLATAIASQMALALENTRLYQDAQGRLRETSTLLAVAEILSAAAPSVEVFRRIARELCRAFRADTVGVHALNDAGDALVPIAGYRVPPRVLDAILRHPFVIARMPVPELWRQPHAVWTSDGANDPRFDREVFTEIGPMSVLFAPTLVRGETRGALFVIWWRTGREFAPAEIRLLEGVAAQVGLAMENAELVRQTEAKLKETESLLSVSRALSSTLDLDAVLRHLLRSVARAVRADSVGIWMTARDGPWMEPLTGYRLPPERIEALRGMRLPTTPDSLYGEAVRARRPVVLPDVASDPRVPAAVREGAPHRTQLFVPIVAREAVLGGVTAVWWTEPRTLAPDELSLVEAIANQAGVALENARLFGENRRRLEELSVLYEVSQAVTGQLDRDTLLEALYAQVSRGLGVRDMLVALGDGTADELDIALSVRDGVRTAQPRVPRGVGLVSIVIDTRQPLRTADYFAECARRGVEPVGRSAPPPHWLGVPMTAGDRVVGALGVRSTARVFSEDDERLLMHIAGLAALAFESARLFEERTDAYRELETAQDQLLRTEKLRVLGEMASGVAHDFNNLLASILGRTQLLLDRVHEPQAHQWLEVIERSALDGARTVRQLQEFTRIRRDQAFAPVDLSQVVRDALDITQGRWRDEARSRGVAIEVRTVLADVPPIAGDGAELREALTNLVLNAVDAMPGGGRLTLTTHGADDRVEVVVSDTGLGMSESVRRRIFDPFFTTKGPRGTGLGLSMTYGIVSRHDGDIEVESQDGHGTTFRLSFPRATEQVAVEPPPAAAVARARPVKCLVVDDEEAVADVIGDVLAAAGHTAAVLLDGTRAVERFREERFDIVLTDLAMPGISGWEIAKGIKAIAPDVPVVLLTGFGVEVPAEQRQANGVDMVMVKPVQITAILDAVATLTQRRPDSSRTEDP